jgi:hypothetical protein
VIFAGEGVARGGASVPGRSIGNKVAKNPLKVLCGRVNNGMSRKNRAGSVANRTDHQST